MFLRADGGYATVLDRGHIIRNEDGVAIRIIGAMLDFTDRQRTGQSSPSMRNALV